MKEPAGMSAIVHMHTKYSHLIIMWWQLVEELFDSELLTRTVDVRDFVLRQTGKI